MLKTKIYASQVSNLSDARYFAAWGVEYIGFIIDSQLSIQSIREMIDWVEGPKYIMELTAIDSSPEVIDALASLNLDKIMTPPFFKGYLPPTIDQIPTTLLEDVSYSEEQIIKLENNINRLNKDEIKELKKACLQSRIWLDVDFEIKDLDFILTEIKPYGFVLKGGEEEKVGLKSFDDLDSIFEALEIFE